MITNEWIKCTIDLTKNCITNLFNAALTTGVHPWKFSITCPILKNGDPYDPTNYRPISLSSCLGKLFNTILHNRLKSYCEDYNLITKEQGGFRKNFRTSDNIFILHSLIQKYGTNKKKKLFICFIDFKQAFDSIDRQKLLYKLASLEIRGKFFQIIKNLYKDAKMLNGLTHIVVYYKEIY